MDSASTGRELQARLLGGDGFSLLLFHAPRVNNEGHMKNLAVSLWTLIFKLPPSGFGLSQDGF
jgi:hypothetical protein